MSKELKRTYFAFLLPSILGFAFADRAKAYDFFAIGQINFLEIVAPAIFILCVVFAVAWPIFYRTLFAHRKRFNTNVSENDLIKFERNLIYVTMITPYLALAAYTLELPRFYTAGAVLLSLYAAYYFYPSKRRLAFERRIFRAK